jgi:hypothetical protein
MSSKRTAASLESVRIHNVKEKGSAEVTPVFCVLRYTAPVNPDRRVKFPSFVQEMIPAYARSTKTHPMMRKDGEEFYFDVEEKLPDSIEVKPQEKRSITLSFHLPKGEYDFLCGYVEGVDESRGLASNRLSFDIDDQGRALEVRPSSSSSARALKQSACFNYHVIVKQLPRIARSWIPYRLFLLVPIVSRFASHQCVSVLTS